MVSTLSPKTSAPRERRHSYTTTNVGSSFKLLTISFGLFFILIFVAIFGLNQIVVLFPKMAMMFGAIWLVLIFGIPVWLYILKRKKTKRSCTVIIFDDKATVEFPNETQVLSFYDIKSFKFEYYKNLKIPWIVLKNGKRFLFPCDSEDAFGQNENLNKYAAMSQDLENAILQFSKSQGSTQVTQLVSDYDKPIMFWALLVGAVMTLLIGTFSLSRGAGIPGYIYGGIAILVPLWIGYFRHKNRK